MGEAHFFDIRGQGRRQLAVCHEAVFLRCALNMPLWNMAPRPQMNLINRDRRTKLLALRALLYPFLIMPLMLVDISNDAGGLRSQFSSKAIGVGLVNFVVVETGIDSILIEIADLRARHKGFPDPQLVMAQMHRVGAAIPVIETANYGDGQRIGRPDREMDTGYPVLNTRVRPHFLIDTIISPLPEKIEVVVTEDGLLFLSVLLICRRRRRTGYIFGFVMARSFHYSISSLINIS